MKKKLILLAALLTFFAGKQIKAQSNWAHVDVVSPTDTLLETASVIFDKQNRPWVLGLGTPSFTGNFLWGLIGGSWQSWGIISGAWQILPTRKSMVTDTNNVIFGLLSTNEYFTFDVNTATMNNYVGTAANVQPATVLNHVTNDKWIFENNAVNFVLEKFDGSNFTLYPETVVGLEFINDCIVDNNGNLYVVGNSMSVDTLIAKYDGSQWTNYSYTNTPLLTNHFLYNLTVDKTNNIWFLGQYAGGGNYSLFKFNGSTFTDYAMPAYIKSSSGIVWDLGCDSTNNLWMISDSGLIKFDGNTWTLHQADAAYPLYQGNNIAIDKNNTIWITHEYGGGNWTGCLLFNENALTTINGYVYNDANQNGIKDAGEQGIPNDIVYSSSGAVANSDSSGNYYCWYPDSSATYTISHQLKKYRTQTSLPPNHTVTPASQATSGYDFGIYAIPNVNDAQINASVFPVRPGFDAYCYLTYQNIGTTVLSDTVQLTYDPAFTYLSASVVPTIISSNTVKWAYTNFIPGSLANITVTLNLSAGAVIGDTLYSVASIGPLAQDTVPADNVFNIESVVTGSFDPNEKAVQPASNITSNEWLYYTIYFQNTGTDTAFTVIIRDTLDANLDFTTFEFLGSSHPVAINYSGAGILRFSFNNILLPDSNTNEPLSHGFVSYRIKTKNNLPVGTQINNTASIYFDFNSPIVTNTTQNIISNPVFITEPPLATFDFQLTPNPAKDIITLSLNYPNYQNHPITISIIDATGKTILTTRITTSNYKLQTSNFAKGMYTIKLDNGKQIAVKKFLKE